MGRTKRKRNRNKNQPHSKNLDGEEAIISLRKWMTHHNWKNSTDLHLRDFEATGRGVYSTKSFACNDLLIEVPFELLITLDTIKKSGLLKALVTDKEGKLKFQDLLIFFVVVEKSKGSDSKWRSYLNSLPQQPPWLPVALAEEELPRLPAEVARKIHRSRWDFEQTWDRLQRSIDPKWNRNGRCVLDVNSFAWAFTMVNTRSVYVDPGIIHELSGFPEADLRRLLSDEPCMALCPFLDMFNHGCNARTEAGLKRRDCGWFYELRTLSPYKKHEQVFISYGAHDNLTLLCEYGFFIPRNNLDAANFRLDEVLSVSEKQISSKQNRFLLERNLNEGLYVGFSGMSFNLKAVIYLLLEEDLNLWAVRVFSERYPVQILEEMRLLARKLLEKKIEEVKKSLLKVQNKDLEILGDYLKYCGELFVHFNEQLK